MSEYEKNVYTNLFEYPTKHIVKLELENEEKDKEIERLNNVIDELEELIDSYELGKYDYQIPVYVLKEKLEKLKESEK